MDHEAILTRQALVMILILLCGIVPDRLRRSRALVAARQPQEQPVQPGRPRAHRTRILRRAARPGPSPGRPGRRARPASTVALGQHLVDPRSINRPWWCGWMTCAKSCSSKNDATTRFGLSGAPTPGNARPRVSLKKPPGTFRVALVGDSIGAGWGVNAEDRFESILEEAWDDRARASAGGRRRDHQLCGAGAFPGPALASLRPARLADGTRPGDLRVDRRGHRLGRTAAALLCWRAGLAGTAPSTVRLSKHPASQPFGSPDQYKRALQPRHWEILAGRLPIDDGRLPRARRADLLGARSAGRRGRATRGASLP